jgi:hypothetical protein
MNKSTMWEQLRVQLEEGKKAPLRSRRQPVPTAASGFVNNW